ncbi:MAG: HDOD domain-containing protein [Phycisphaerales bacterium]
MPEIAIEHILTSPHLPTLPAVALRVLELTGRPEVKLQEMAECVQADQALTSRILKTVNSSFYGLSTPCPTISRALCYLGLNTVKSVVLGFSLVDSIRQDDDDSGFDFEEYWRHCMYSAAAARILAEQTRVCDPEEAFVTALLQDVGMIAMHKAIPDEYAQLLAEVRDHEMLPAREREAFGFDHAEVGSHMAEQWRLPEQLTAPIRFHHKPEAACPSIAPVARILNVANLSADCLSAGTTSTKLADYIATAQNSLNLDRPSAEHLLEVIGNDAGQLSSLLKVEIGKRPDIDSILAQASERMMQHQIAIQQAQDQLQRSNDQLARETVTDALTSAFNRKHFDCRLEAMFDDAVARNGSVAVAFVDVDRFKGVNDTHGHQVGDTVLIELSARMQAAVGECGIVCRYGGEEFAVLFPDADLRTAAAVGEKMRRAIEQKTFRLGSVPGAPEELAITISVGVAAADSVSRSILSSPGRLLQAADKASYAAKKGGRNCVRAFSPKVTPAETRVMEAPAQVNVAAAEEAQVTVGPHVIHEHGDAAVAYQTAPTIDDTVQTNVQREVGAKVHPVTVDQAESILVIDDDPTSAALVRHVIEQVEQLKFQHALSAEHALAMLNDSIANAEPLPTLILCDLDLGERATSGIEFTQIIKRHEVLNLTPVVVLCGSCSGQEIHEAMAAGANAVLPKQRISEDPAHWVNHLIGMWSSVDLAA